MLVSLHALVEAVVPLNRIVLVPFVAPKFAPDTTTTVPTGPHDGLKPLITGPGVIVSVCVLLDSPVVHTATGPVAAPAGTTAWTLVFDQLVTEAFSPLIVTALPPCDAPNPSPEIVTVCPTLAVAGATLSIRDRAVQTIGRMNGLPVDRSASYATCPPTRTSRKRSLPDV
jgi:hypothetical protein